MQASVAAVCVVAMMVSDADGNISWPWLISTF